jgi:hypothetical protein
MLKHIARTIQQRNAKTMTFQKQSLHNVVSQPLEREVEEIRIPVPWGHISGDLYIRI